MARSRVQALGDRSQGGVRDVLDVAIAPFEALDLARVGVETDHVVPRLAEGDGKRQADVAEADDSDLHRRESIPVSADKMRRSIGCRAAPRQETRTTNERREVPADHGPSRARGVR